MEASKHELPSEQPRFTLITNSEEVAGTAGGLGGLLGSATTLIYLSNSGELPALAGSPTSSAPDPTVAPGHSVHVPTIAEAIPSHDNSFPLEYQIGGVMGAAVLVAFIAAAVTSGVRYAMYRRKVNFTSDISPEELRDWYKSPSARSSKDI
jgi:hypothetical protein